MYCIKKLINLHDPLYNNWTKSNIMKPTFTSSDKNPNDYSLL
jgi:hypothetical protein